MANGLIPGVVGIYGPSGSLKTSMGLSWPKRLKVFDFDLGVHRAWKVGDLVEAGEVEVETFATPDKGFSTLTRRSTRVEGSRELWNKFLKSYAEACEDGEVKAIQLDTNTVVWKLIQDAYLQELQDVQIKQGKPEHEIRKQLIQIEFGEPNTRMRTILQSAPIYKKWLVLIMHDTDEYAPITMGGKPVIDPNTGNPRNAPTGNKVPDGFRYIKGICDWLFVSSAKVGDDGRIVPSVKIEKSAMGIDLVGTEIEWFTYDKLVTTLVNLGRING